jgi:hypothetical protein
MGDSIKNLAQQQVQKVVSNQAPALQNIVQQVAPQATDALKNLMPGSSGRVDPAAEAASLGMSLDQYNNLSTEELNRLKGSSEPGFFSKAGSAISNFFTDDPNSGWYDTMQSNKATAADAAYYQTPEERALAQAKADASYYTPGTPGQSSGGVLDAFKSGLKKVATPANLETAAGIAGGLGSMYFANQGTKEATAAYDQALADIKNRQDISGDTFNAVADSPEQLAMRAQALKGLSDRASMGLTPEDTAELQKINRQSAQQFKANNATISQDMARRGMTNSGLGLAQSMGAADQALQNQALAGQNQAAQSFAAKQGALNNLAGASNTALQNDYSRQMGKASNLSAVNQFNAQQKAQSAANAAAIQQQKAAAAQAAGTAKGQGVLDITKGAIQTLGK